MGGIWPTITTDQQRNIQYRKAPERQSAVLDKMGLWPFHWIDNANWGEKDQNQNPPFRQLNFFCLSHLIDGDGFYIDRQSQQTIKLKPGDFIISTPQQAFYLGSDKKVYHEDFISFCGPLADQLLQNGIIKDGVYSLGQARLLLPIIEKLEKKTTHHQIAAAIDILALLNDIHFGKYDRNSHQSTVVIDVLLEEIKRDSRRNWSLESMAEFCSLSKNHFRKTFKEQTGMLPKNYLDSIRMDEASILLVNSPIKLNELAEKYHYSDAFHFSRSFKRIMGISPKKFRDDHQSSSLQ